MSKQQTLNLGRLSLEQLGGLKQQLESEIETLTRAFDGLRGARGRFQDSKGCLEAYKTMQEGQEMLVPMTSSLYVSGKVDTAKSVLVDVGTGYFIQQSIPRAQQFFDKRSNQMSDNMTNIADAIAGKRKQLNNVLDVMQKKMQAMRGEEAAEQK
jgi:prefoldin alpha subunit